MSGCVRAFLLFALLLLPARSASAINAEGGLTLSGVFMQGGLVRGRVPPGSTVTLDGAEVMVGARGYFVIGFGRDAAGEAVLAVIYPGGRTQSQTLTISPREYDIERVSGLPPKTVDIPPEEMARRQKERGMVGRAREPLSERLDWTQPFVLPAQGRISGVYGSQRILNGQPRTPHFGLDVAAPVHTPVYAPQGGIVTLAEPDFLLEGGIVIIDHGFGVFSTMFHMQSVDVRSGDPVEKGQRVGSIGATGRASGPHVDWRINWRNVRLDPALLVDVEAATGE